MLVGKGRGLSDGKHDRTFEIEDCQTKNMTGFLKLRYCQTNYESDFRQKISILPNESYELDFGQKIKLILPDES
ncbi:hypothetical protein RCL_jg27217.t1 [Rhizophagus clarus]|uniref:Uncharacterized protein n=1 Tax=Rhizophagus clarus TaxID=94130 RepID=A0A8H3QVH6_9GLOM|nr:hypothetical protein RCL_jg27217.t1 [Rhizophagus clarus]